MFLATAGSVFAQALVTGTVTDAKTGETLIGVTILIKGTTQGTTTDIDGKFKFATDQLKPASVLVFSYIGYTSIEMAVGANTRLDVKLESSSVMLDEMVVIGYGSVKKRNVLGAVSKVDSRDMAKIPVASIDQALQGRAAGVQVTQNTGAPGEGVSVRIRGIGSINSSNTPLYIVDGMPTEDALNLLSPNDIESISVLKDASAAAIYGSRATNGIVLITTKKGSKGQAKVTYNGQFGFQKPVRLTPMVNTADYVTIYNEAAVNDNTNLPVGLLPRQLITTEQAAKFADVNYLKELFHTAPVTSHELSISGGSETTNYLISSTYFNQKGIIENTGYTRGTARIDVNSDVSKWLTIGMSSLAGISNTSIIGSSGDGAGGNGGSVIRYAFFRNPAIPVFMADGTTYVDRPSEYFGSGIYDSYLGDGYSPIGMAAYNDNTRRDDSYLGKAYFKAKIYSGMTFTTNFGMDYRSSNSRRFDRTWGTAGRIGNPNGLSVENVRTSNWTLNNLLNYEKSFAGSHNFSALLGFEANKKNAKYLSASDANFPIQQTDLIYIGNGSGIKTTSQGESSSTLASFFGRFSYDYKQKYYVSATVRRDGTSRFIGANKWGTFGSVSAGWAMKQEAFLKDVSWLESLKVRAGYGAIGNQETSDYPYANIISPNYNYPFGGTTVSGYAQSSLGNSNLKWETSYQYNAGIDAELWKGAFALSLDYFYKVTSDMLVRASNPPSVGYAERPWINSGSVLNRGVELEATYRGNKSKFTYSVGGNLTYLHNEVLKLDGINQDGLIETGTYATQTAVGQPIGSFYLYEMQGIFQNQTQILISAKPDGVVPGDIKIKDQNGDTHITPEDRKYLGSAIPKLFGGINLTAGYQNFDLSLFFQGTYGNKIYSQVNQDIEGFYRGFPVTQRYFDQRWTGEGTSNTQPRASWNAKSINAMPSSRFLEDGSYIRLKNLQLGYTIPQKPVEAIGLSRVRVYVSGTNLLTFTKYSGLDPEMTVSDNSKAEGDTAAGIDWGTYPSAMTIMFGMNLNFK